MSKKVLVVVDMQKDFLEADGKLSLGKDTTELKKRVAEKIRSFEGPIVVTLDLHDKEDVEFKQFPEHCVRGTEGANLSDEIAKAVRDKQNDVEFVQKQAFCGGKVSDLLLQYQKMGYDFEFVGVCTHICVHDNVAALVHRAKEELDQLPNVTVYKDMVDDFDDEMAKVALTRLERLSNTKVI